MKNLMKKSQTRSDTDAGAGRNVWFSCNPAWMLAGVIACCATGRMEAASEKRCFLPQCSPVDASVQMVLEPGNNETNRRQTLHLTNGFKTDLLKIYDRDRLVITFSRPDYETFTTNFTFEQVRTAVASDRTPIQIAAQLAELRREVPVTFEGGPDAKFFTNGVESPGNASLQFSRSSAHAEWSTVPVRVERPSYKTVNESIALNKLETCPRSSEGRRKVAFALDEIEKQVEVLLIANEEGALVFLNGLTNGATPVPLKLMFRRADSSAPWSDNLVRVEKSGFEYRPPGSAQGSPSLTTNLTLEGAMSLKGALTLSYFQPVRSFEVPLRKFVEHRGKVTMVTTNSISAKDKNEPRGLLTEFAKINANDELITGRIGVGCSTNTAGKEFKLAVALPFREEGEIVGSSIWLVSQNGGRSKLIGNTRAKYYIDPCLTRDGQKVYYSSNEGGQWGIYVKDAVSGGPVTAMNPNQGVDVEPAVFTSSAGQYRVAFTRYSLNAAPGTPPRIMVQTEDGRDFLYTETGHSPAWSWDGTRIAFVTPNNKICIMDATGENPKEYKSSLTTVEASPVWMRGDKQILYASASSAEEARDGTGNFDLYSIFIDGGDPQQLTSNPSFDGFPVVASDGENQIIYFLTNRGAQSQGQESWHVNYFSFK